MKSFFKTSFLSIFLFTHFSLYAQPPANDDCANAISITQLDGTCNNYSFQNATFDFTNGSCAPLSANNVWFSFVAQGTYANINLVGNPKLAITVLTIPNGCGNTTGAVEFACDISPLVMNNLTIGTEYYVIISELLPGYTNFDLCILNPPPPPNDDPCNAINITPGTCASGTTLGANPDFTIPGCPNATTNNAIFYAYTLGANTVGLQIDITAWNITGDISAALLEFPNGCDQPPFLASNDATYCGPTVNTLDFTNLTPGSTVYLMIASSQNGAGSFTDMCFTENEGDPPCAANISCADAEVITIPNPADPVCVNGCNTGMPSGGFTNCGGAFTNPTAWYTFNSGPNNTVVISLESGDLTSPNFVLMSSCNTILDCNTEVTTIQPNQDYWIAVADGEGNTGNFQLCITLLSITAPCIQNEAFVITGTSMGSPTDGPFKPCEIITFQYTTNFFSGGVCQWLHSFIPYISECWENQVPNIVTYPAGTSAGNMSWYPAGTVYWKPQTNNPPSALGINGNGQICLIGTSGCMNFVGGNGSCGSTDGTPMPAGWIVTNASGSCGNSTAPNMSWGITQGCNTYATKSISFQMQVPCNACTSCDSEEGFVVGMASFPDGATGGWSNPQCNGNGLLKKKLVIECCTPPTMVIVDGTTCSDKTFFADITLDPPNSTIEWTVVNANGVSGASNGSGATFSQTLHNPTNSPKVVIYSVTPISPTGCRGPEQELKVTVLPAIVINIGPDKQSCPGALVTLGNIPLATGGAGAPFTIKWSNGKTTDTIQVAPSITTTYTVTVTDSQGCEKLAQVTVDISGALEVTITPDPAEFCFSDRYNHSLKANVNGTNAPFTYKWSTPWGTQTNQSITILSQYDGTFQVVVEVTDAIGCKGVGSLYVTLYPDPLIIFLDKPDRPLCPGEPWQVSSSPLYIDGTVFSSDPPGMISFDGQLNTTLMIPGTDYWFYADYTDPSTGCSSRDSFKASTILLPDPEANDAGPFCANDNNKIQLTGTPTGGSWSGIGVTPDGKFTPSVAGEGIHKIIYTIGSGNCTKDTSIEITVLPIPQPTINNLIPFCKSISPNPVLTASIPGGTWSAPVLNDGTVPVDILAPGSYSVTYTVSIDGCEGKVTGTIDILPQPSVNLNPEGLVCNKDPFNKGKSKIDLDNAILSGDSNGTWNEITNPLSGAVHLGGNVYDFFGVPTGTIAIFTYTLVAQAPCETVVDTFRIFVDEECDCPKLDFNPADPLCNDNAILDLNTLKIKAGLGTWSLISTPAGTNPGTLTGSIFNATNADPGIYTVLYTLNPPPSEPDCPKDLKLTITVNPEVTYQLIPEVSVCHAVPKPPKPKTMVNLDNLFIGQPVVGNWVNNSNVGTNISGNTWDFTGVTLGNYSFTFVPTGAQAPCTNDPTTIIVKVTDECDCPTLQVITPTTALCNDALSIVDLNTMINSSEAGVWTLVKDPDGVKNTLIPNGKFDPTGKTLGTYDFQFEINITPPEDCDSLLTVSVTLNPAVIFQLQPTAEVCNFDPKNQNDNQLDFGSSTIWASNPVAGTWEDTDNSGAVKGSGNIWTFNGVPTGVYTFTFTPSGALPPCQNIPQTIEITVVDNCDCEDLPALAPIGAVCNNQSVINLIAPAGYTGVWSIKSKPAGSNPVVINGSSIDIGGKDEGTYTLRFKFDNQPSDCKDTAFVNFVLYDYKSAGLASPAQQYCEKTKVIIDLQDELTGEDPGGLWTEVGPSSAGSALTGTILNIEKLLPGHYIFQYKHVTNGACPEQISEIDITVNPNPKADAGSSFQLTCEQASTIIGGIGSSTGSDIAYQWTEKNNNPIPNPKELFNEVKLEGIYYLKVTNTNTGCTAFDSVEVTSDPNRPQGIVIERNNPTCYGYKDGYIKVAKIEGGAPPILYSLNDGPFSSINSWTNLSGSNNTLKIKDANGCLLVLDNIILVEPTLVTVEMGNDTLINLGDTVLIDPDISIPHDSISSIIFSSDYDFINCTGCFDITVFPNQTTTYSVEVKDKNGCSDKDSKRVVVRKGVNIFVPNIFTPNGDGNNDKVFISTNDREIKQINSFQIYDRWGEKVYEALNYQPNDPSTGWDGTLKGQKCNPAVYVYWAEIELFDGTKQIIKGDVTLMR
ncbi:MAG TPA: gliding motility-associated C-terminal domain-containing protein [Saprospiraceae bacterium]|jgi:gliding motility-associated-like protein|nr:MAG: PKD domain-containing protein [Candidatus Parvibacillus calidus]MBX2936465.1 gliding motility-associated C-terminal domain-containing protein [Saprospiraceae bacterium]MCB0590927.1 gliding motility-associated C-terminal domain-containing protein [Saprospiraceae bacterium]MCC7149378.1 gliding motility-associated C-terminal domain-containing protein [Saprospiraceae bacterium]MCO5283041.1 gliding motility-associated C-terminal domain-containing protein [Saprospiraceae bacterium]